MVFSNELYDCKIDEGTNMIMLASHELLVVAGCRVAFS
jgi:hypothetical protein